MGTSLNPKDQVKGGLMSDFDGTLQSIRFGNYIYDFVKGDPESPQGAPGVGAYGKVILPDGEETLGIWSLGGEDEWIVQDAAGNAITPDSHGYVRGGVQVESTKGNTGTRDSSNFSRFVVAMGKAGFPINLIADRIDVLDNTYAHWVQETQKAREGLATTKKDDREKSILVASKILPNGLPSDAAKRAKGAAAAPPTGASQSTATGSGSAPAANAGTQRKTTAAAPAAPAGNDMENEAAVQIASDALPLLRAKKGGTAVKKTAWNTVKLSALQGVAAFAALEQTDPTRTAASRLLSNMEWLALNDGFTIDAATGDVTVPAA